MNINSKLAEICGIHAGDGYLRNDGKRRELDISGNIEEKTFYDTHIIPLFSKYFKIKLCGKYFPSRNTYGFVIRKKEIVEKMNKIGFPYGKKSLTVKVPEFILHSNDKNIRRSFLRGVFDTDGCISFDKRIYNKNIFKKNRNFYPRLFFATVSKQLAEGIKILSNKEKFNYKIYTHQPKKKNENLRYILQTNGVESLIKWFNKINPKNNTKLSRVQIWEKFRFCPPFTTYKERLKILNGKLNPNLFYKDNLDL